MVRQPFPSLVIVTMAVQIRLGVKMVGQKKNSHGHNRKKAGEIENAGERMRVNTLVHE